MKAVLVIDMPTIPENCMSCYIVCRSYQTGDTRPSWCPLRPLPSKIEKEIEVEINGKTHIISDWEFITGWNTLLDVITKETKDE